MKTISLLIFFISSTISQILLAERFCTYTTYKWNTLERKAVDFKQVKHLYSQLKEYEIDKVTGCTVCQEDQIELKIGTLKLTKICHIFSRELQQQLSKLYSQGLPILKLVGYRVGMTKGEIDSFGNRSQFSNHSFGIALDINDEQNGLYDQCIHFNQQCRLIKGGEWNADQIGSLSADSETVQLMKQLGFKWGGEIQGKQKDFMHFSPTGY